MNNLLPELQKLSTASRVIQPEQSIMQRLIEFDSLFGTISNNADLNSLIGALFSLYNVNDGSFSVQCSISIAFRISKIFKAFPEQNSNLNSAMTNLLTKLNSSSIIAIGELYHRLGSLCTSLIPKVIESLLNLGEDLRFHSLFALRAIFKTKAHSLSQFIVQVYKLTRKCVDITPESNQIIALKLMKAILVYDSSYYSSAIECCDSCLLKQQTPFVRYQAGKLAAFCAATQINNGVSNSISVIKKYSSYLSPIISRFLEILPQSTIKQNATELFSLISRISPHDTQSLLIYLSPKEKQTLFGQFLSDPKPSASQITSLQTLSSHGKDIVSCVSSALLVSRSVNQRDVEIASNFFSKLATSSREVAEMVLKSSLTEMTKIKSDIMTTANSIAVKSILEADQTLIISLKSILDDYVNTISMITDYSSIRYVAMWSVLSFIPDEFIDKQALAPQIQKTSELLSSQQSTFSESKWSGIFESVLSFISYHPTFPHSDLVYNIATANLNRLSEPSISSLARFVVNSHRNSDALIDFFVNKVLTMYPGKDYLKKQVERVVITGDDLLITKIEEVPTIRNKSAQYLIEIFPKLLKCCQSTSTDTIITNLISQSNNSSQMLVSHSILLKIVQDEDLSKNLPHSFIGLILKTLKGSDFLRIQISCEIVSYAIEKQLSMIDALFKFIEMNKRAVSCLLLSAVMCRIHLSDSLLSRAILFIDERLFSHYSAPFALHALSTALSTHINSIEKLGLGHQHTNLLLKLLHDTTSLHPVIIHLISTVFIDFIPIIAKTEELANDILSIIESIRATPYSFAKGVFYLTIVSLCRVSYQIASRIPIAFPESINSPRTLLLRAADAYCLIGRNRITNQITRVIFSACQSNTMIHINSVSTLISREDGPFLLSLIQSVLIDDEYPLNQTEKIVHLPATMKLIVLKSLALIFNTVTINEAPTIALALCKAISSGILELQSLSFPMLSSLLTRFCFKNLQNHFADFVPIAFKLPFEISGGFLVSFMNKDNLELCFQSLSSCNNDSKQSSEYMMMFLRALKICRETFNQKVPEFVKKFIPMIHSQIYNICKSILKSNSNEYIEYQSIWSDLWQSLIYCNYINDTQSELFNPKYLISFFILQLRKCTNQPWKLNGLIYGIVAVIQFFGDKISIELIKEAIDTSIILYSVGAVKEIIQEPVTQLYKYTSQYLLTVKGQPKDSSSHQNENELNEKVIKNNDAVSMIWNNILYCVLNIQFDVPTAACCFSYFDSQELERLTFNITKSLLSELALQDEEKCMALFKVLVSKTQKGINTIIDQTIEWSKQTPNSSLFAFRLLTFLIRKTKTGLDFDKIADFSVLRFKRGGLNFVAGVLMNNPEVGIQIAIRGPTNLAALSIVKDHNNANLYIKFLMVCVEAINNEKFIDVMLKIAMKELSGNGVSNELVSTCVQIFKQAQNQNNDLFKSFWDSQNEADQELCVRNILSYTK